MGKLTEFVEEQQLSPDLAQQPAVDGVCPYWPDCHRVRWKYLSRRRGDEEWKHVSDKYKCAWRRGHRVQFCGTYIARRREYENNSHR